MILTEKIQGIGIGLALILGMEGSGCCVRPETIADTLRIQDAYATVELCNSLGLSRESEHIRQECRKAEEEYEGLLRETSRESMDDSPAPGYLPEPR